MIFNDIVNNTGLIQNIETNLFGDTGFGQISNNTQRLQLITNYINEGYSRFRNIVVKSDGRWQFDDNNYSDYPFAITNLVANQQDYQFAVNFLEIISIEVQNTGGVWYTLNEVSQRDYANDNVSMTQRFIVPSQPYAFMRTANSIFLLPAPNFARTGALKVKYQRPPAYYLYTDTTKVPGFAETLHPYLVDYATWKYAMSHGMDIGKEFGNEVIRYEQVEIPEFYSDREKDNVKRFYPKYKYRR